MNALLGTLGWVLLFYLPPAVLLLWLFWFKRDHEARARAPFTEQPLRVAGQSARDRADQLVESAFEDLLALLIGCPLTGLAFALVPALRRPGSGVVALGVAAAAAFVVGYRVRRRLRESWNYRLGATGEQVVGRELDRLMAQGYQVFHDMPFEGWNIDHVVVGPRGVFAIETKTWRKPPKAGDLKAEIVLDGDTLILPNGKSYSKAIQQAARNARTLTEWIAEAAGEKVPAVPAVALPGWSLVLRRYGEVAVYSATNMSEHLPKRGKAALQPEQIQRIAFHLTQRCQAGSGAVRSGGPGRG